MTALEKLQTGLCALGESRRLASHDQWSPAQLAKHGHERLLALLDHARTHSPFYRERLAGVRLGPGLELASLPSLDKATMLENFDELVTDRRLHLVELERPSRTPTAIRCTSATTESWLRAARPAGVACSRILAATGARLSAA